MFQALAGIFFTFSFCNAFVNTPFIISRRSLLIKTCFAAMSDNLNSDNIRFGFTVDVIITRAIDAILPTRTDGTLHEPCMKHADEYVQLAEQQNGALDQDEITEKGYSC